MQCAAGTVAGNPDPVHSAEPEPAEQQRVVHHGVQAQLPAPRVGGRGGHGWPDAAVRLVTGGQHQRRRRRRRQPAHVPVVLGRSGRRHDDDGHGQRVHRHVALAQRAAHRRRRRVPLPLAHQSHIAADQQPHAASGARAHTAVQLSPRPTAAAHR